MCCYKSLVETNNGKIYQTPCEANYIIEFNNLIIIENSHFLIEFYHNVAECYYSLKDRYDDKRDIIFNTSNLRMKFVFNLEEIKELFYLLETAYLTMPLQEIVE
jgi:hypothetical protein